MTNQTSIVVGDRVEYSHKFLRSIGCFTGDLCFAKGEVEKIDMHGKDFVLCVIKWEMKELPTKVNIKNLSLIKNPTPKKEVIPKTKRNFDGTVYDGREDKIYTDPFLSNTVVLGAYTSMRLVNVFGRLDCLLAFYELQDKEPEFLNENDIELYCWRAK